MSKVRISMIAAAARNNLVIGKEGGGLPWYISEDLKYFKQTTIGHPIILGRKTWEEFKGSSLPGRVHIVVTGQDDYEVHEPHMTAKSVEEAIEKAKELENGGEIFITGGASIYEQGLRYADRIYLTLVDVDIDGPAKFPDYVSAGFNDVVSSRKSSDDKYEYEFLVLEK